MVCSLGNGRMAVMARLLAAGSFSQTMAEEIGNQKLAARYICRELCDADEANLLDEEDMHVFGLKPMTEPLQLVCCNACKKPIKASQYAAHAELCRSLISAEENVVELDSSMGNRKPPRKEKKKLLTAYANPVTLVGQREKSEPMNAIDVAASESQLDSRIGTASLAVNAQPCVGVASMTDISVVHPGNMDQPACVMLPPTKRSKLISAGHQLLLDDLEMASGVTKTTSNSGAFSYIPVPLGTKIYYSQRNNRHRSALNHLYSKASTKELCSDIVSSKMSEEDMIPVQTSSSRDSSVERMGGMLNGKRQMHTLSSVRSPDQILAQSSEVCLGRTGEFLSASNFSNQFPVDDAQRPGAASVGLTRSKYVSKSYSFAGNSGKPLGSMQQPNGSVPVT